MDLRECWNKYKPCEKLTYDNLPEDLKSQGRIVKFPAKSIIMNAGDFPEYVYFIITGTVSGIRKSPDGNEYHYFYLDKYSGSVGCLEVFATKEKSVATIVASSDVVALKLNSAIMYEYAMNNISILLPCYMIIAEHLYERSKNDGRMYRMRGGERIINFLVEYYNLHKANKSTVVIKLTYQDLSNRLGISVRTVGRCIKQLKEQNLITSHNRSLSITPEQYAQLIKLKNTP